MSNISRRRACHLVLVLALSGTSLVVSAADRRFVPVPATEYQKLQVINGVTIISAAGKRFHAGASIAATSSRQAWLSISVKNTGTAPVAFDDAALVVMSGGKALGMKSAEEVMGKADREDAAVAAIPTLAPGALVARQFQMDLPKRSKTTPATLKVAVTVEGEAIEFDFNELN